VSLSTVRGRFWSKVDKGPDCWLWKASTFRTGRGQFRVGVRNQQAHRVAWELAFLCVRPDHQVVVERKVGASNLARTPDRRFAAMVVTGPGCWSWTGSTDHLGYGQFLLIIPGEGRRMVRAHRFAWEQASGAIPDGVDVLHRCGNRICVRPDHLALRDPEETSMLPTPRQLQILRVWVDLGMKWKSHARIAEELGVAPGTVATQLYLLRKRLGVASTPDAVQWLDAHMHGWRDSGPS
jgi:DNA-binding CsgD family transcriptional regulator